MAKKLDIHRFDQQLKDEKERLNESEISQKNKDLIEKFCRDTSISENPSKATVLKYYQVLRIACERYIDPRDIDSLNLDDLKEIKYKLDQEKLKAWTKNKYGNVIKKYYRYIGLKVKWWNTHIKKSNRPRVKASDILTEDEVDRLIKSTESIRDTCFISMLYELGARISEIGNMKIKDLSKVKYGYVADIEGKTGHRTPILINSTPFISKLLNNHPRKDTPEAPLWGYIDYIKKTENDHGEPKFVHISYNGLKKIVKTAKKKAGIKKRIYPHLFRHTRATHSLVNGELNEAQAKIYFGWAPDSDMLSTYSHLVSANANEQLLKAKGLIEEKDENKVSFTPKECPACKHSNKYDAKYCEKCFSFLDLKTAVKMDQKHRDFEKFTNALIGEINKDQEIQNLIFERILSKPFMEKLLDKFN